MTVTWKNKDAALRKMIKNLAVVDKREVRVGFFDKQYGTENNNLQVAQVAQWMEEGVPANNVPPRPMFRVELANKINESGSLYFLGSRLNDAMEGIGAPTKSLERVGEYLTGKLQGIIAQGVAPSNSREWSTFKGGLPPLVYTGFMRDSVGYRIRYKGTRQ